MRKENKADYSILFICFALSIIGILILSSVSIVVSQQKFGHPFHFLNRQIFFGFLPGIILGYLFFKIKLSFLKKISPFLLLINLFLMTLIFVPYFGLSSGGASRWLNFKFFSFQPAEFLKITFFIYLAAWLEKRINELQFEKKQKRRGIQEKKGFSFSLLSFFVFLGILALIGLFLIKQPNISTLGVITLIGTIMYFASGMPLWHIIFMVTSFAIALPILIRTAPYRLSRLQVFLNPDFDPLGKGYQIKQALIAIGSGGLFGLGLGMSRQKFGFLPESTSDAIFAILTEELGFLGGIVVIGLFVAFLWRGIRIAKRSPDIFSGLLALGISFWLPLQAFIHIGSSIQVLPLTGIPLPFISYGGSHLTAELISIAILLNISRQIY
jgi:cell division protein FtsW